MQIHDFRCFGAHAGGGNPASVIEGERSDPEARQAFAHTRKTTCVWIDPSGATGVAASIDYYYPHARSPLCLHATLAVGQRLFTQHGAASQLTVMTALHGQRLGLVRGLDGEIYVSLERQPVSQAAPTPAAIAALLAAPGLALLAPARVASVGSPKLLVEVADAATLHGLAPDLTAIAAWSKTAGVSGIYAYCQGDDGSYQGRNFNHLDPALEDSATGVAAGALTALLGHGITLRQGRATGRDCLLKTKIDGDRILVGVRVEPATQ
ncbi:phenazine biosynthesis protein PhzF family protein [Duganella sp. Leaf126]|uniref:PhzF family phenazine biosynthesis protein n=1 Tax=Duganella sp. Leaf126 TaxID=1736266 RepID=UPI0006F95E80|nr:PhzF family phenazine biosynthesis protein [Duganella sp. Leaf126]KQQ33540.1 phenazine biosynthesis protein PhzF family protein [Duganella sp. Leaf126]